MHIVLTVIAGPHIGQTYSFDRHEHFLVGRAKLAHFRLPEKDPFFSRLHFMIEVNPPACRLLDMKSTNGTLVNGKAVDSADLRHGDLIQAGDTILRVTIGSDAGDAVPATILKPSDALATRAASEPVASPAQLASTEPGGIDPVHFSGWRPTGYVIESIIGSGGMGVVYRARRETDNELVAIKAIKPAMAGNRAECQRFLREIEILRQLDHPHIVRLFDAGEADGVLYFVMEYVDGENAHDWVVRQPQPTPIETCVRLMLPILNALHYAHTRGFVHRDVKPSNILLAKEGKKLRPKLADFGLARAYQESRLSGLTLTGDICGTPKFMAPEQITNARRALPASDQYSAAATLYWLLTGRYTHDFSNDLGQLMQQMLLEPVLVLQERRSDVPAALSGSIHRALLVTPDERWGTISEFAETLRSICRTSQC